jgi:hypothetical protein
MPDVQPDDSASQIPVPGGSALSSVSRRAWLTRQLAELDRQDSLELGRLARVDGDEGAEVLGTNGWAPAGSGQVPQSPRAPPIPQPEPPFPTPAQQAEAQRVTNLQYEQFQLEEQQKAEAEAEAAKQYQQYQLEQHNIEQQRQLQQQQQNVDQQAQQLFVETTTFTAKAQEDLKRHRAELEQQANVTAQLIEHERVRVEQQNLELIANQQLMQQKADFIQQQLEERAMQAQQQLQAEADQLRADRAQYENDLETAKKQLIAVKQQFQDKQAELTARETLLQQQALPKPVSELLLPSPQTAPKTFMPPVLPVHVTVPKPVIPPIGTGPPKPTGAVWPNAYQNPPFPAKVPDVRKRHPCPECFYRFLEEPTMKCWFCPNCGEGFNPLDVLAAVPKAVSQKTAFACQLLATASWTSCYWEG